MSARKSRNKTIKLNKRLMLQSLALTSVFLSAGCVGTSEPASVSGLSDVTGPSLPGAQGKTVEDQNRIDRTVARGCPGGLYSRPACDRHTESSAERRDELDLPATIISMS